MYIGYARVSTQDQKLDLQLDALKAAGCEEIFSDIASGARTDRPELETAVNYLRPGDTLVVWQLSRLGRSLQHLIEVVNDLNSKGIAFKSLKENIDTSTAGGRLIFHIFGALAEFERELIRERTNAGLQSARARGRFGGRPVIMTRKQILKAVELMDAQTVAVNDIAHMFGVSRATLYRVVSEYKKREA
jgi:DNA invertase Pin-like site-specific DNA recombinase